MRLSQSHFHTFNRMRRVLRYTRTYVRFKMKQDKRSEVFEKFYDFTRDEGEFYFYLIFNSLENKQLVGGLKYFLKFRCSLLSLTNVCQSNVFIIKST